KNMSRGLRVCLRVLRAGTHQYHRNVTTTTVPKRYKRRNQASPAGRCVVKPLRHDGLLIDAEETWIQDPIDALAEEMMALYNRERTLVYTTIQFYRTDGIARLRETLKRAEAGNYRLGIKAVRGAYMEKERQRAIENGYPDPIQPDKASTDRDFNAAVQFCLQHRDRISLLCGSHNEESNRMLHELMVQEGLASGDTHVWFSQLLGMSDNISFNLAAAGYNVAKYVPFGPVRAVVPYLLRRAEENTSVAGQSSRELQLVRREVARRKAS
ncbi:MAG: proline dehydrogenase family protein, partial [Bacteroidota bacterium]